MSRISSYVDSAAVRGPLLRRPVDAGSPAPGSTPGYGIAPGVALKRAEDQVELSDRARLAATLDADQPFRSDLVQRLRSEIQGGTYDSAEKLDKALDRLISSIDLTA